jgi:hypothetical protein
VGSHSTAATQALRLVRYPQPAGQVGRVAQYSSGAAACIGQPRGTAAGARPPECGVWKALTGQRLYYPRCLAAAASLVESVSSGDKLTVRLSGLAGRVRPVHAHGRRQSAANRLAERVGEQLLGQLEDTSAHDQARVAVERLQDINRIRNGGCTLTPPTGQAPPPAGPGDRLPADPGLIPLTVREIRRLLSAELWHPKPPATPPAGPTGDAATRHNPAGSTNAHARRATTPWSAHVAETLIR